MTLEAIRQNILSMQEVGDLYESLSSQSSLSAQQKRAKLQAFLLKLAQNIQRMIQQAKERYSM